MSSGAAAELIRTYPDEYDATIPDTISLAQFVLQHTDQFGQNIASIDAETGRSMTFDEVSSGTRRLAAALRSRFGVADGRTVALALPNCIEYPLTALAVNLAQGTAALVNPAHTLAEFRHVVHLSQPDLWIATEEFVATYRQLYADDASRPPLVLLHPLSPGEAAAADLTCLAELIESGKDLPPLPVEAIDGQQHAAFIMFSSGTTGLPKGVILTDHNMIAARRQNIELTKHIEPNPTDRTVVMLPLFHTFGISSTMDSMIRGLSFVLIKRFSLKALLTAIQEFRISIMSLVPAIAVLLVKYPVEKQYDLSSIRFVFSGAAALSKELSEQLTEKFGCFVFQGYGMTESSLRTHSNFLGYSREGSIGIVMPFCQSKVVDPDTNETLGPGQVGEICMKGPLIMKGYVGDHRATANTIDEDGWLHSGDLGYFDEDGFFFITDRMKELIKYKGFQVSPTELELVLLQHADLLDAAVVGVPDAEAGEVPKAFVVKRAQSTLTEQQVADFVAGTVSAYKKLRGGVKFVQSLPKTSTGKLLRRQLRSLASKL